MGSIKTFFDSFKEFIWDIIGYMLPGSFLLILLSACVKPNYQFTTPLNNDKNDMFAFVFIVLSYLLGHLIYGFGLIKERLLGKLSYTKRIEKDLDTKETFKISKELLMKVLTSKGITNNLSNASARDVRNLAMSFAPEADQKIYTFIFRSEVSNHTANICLVIGILGLIFSVLNFFIDLFIVDKLHIILYVLLILGYFMLCSTRNRFYAIALGLPFSIYSAKALQ